MQSNRRFLALGLGFLFVCAAASANWSTNRGFQRWYIGGGYSGGYGYGGYGGYGWGGATAGGDYLRGLGVYIDALGRMHVNDAIAARHVQEAYREYLQNRQLRQQIYFQMREDHDAFIASRTRPPQTQAELTATARKLLPPRLAPSQRNPKTGALAWPVVLRTRDLADDRAEVERLFTERAANPDDAGLDSENYTLIHEVVTSMEDALRARINDLTPAQYLLGQRFLKTLLYEARFKS